MLFGCLFYISDLLGGEALVKQHLFYMLAMLVIKASLVESMVRVSLVLPDELARQYGSRFRLVYQSKLIRLNGRYFSYFDFLIRLLLLCLLSLLLVIWSGSFVRMNRCYVAANARQLVDIVLVAAVADFVRACLGLVYRHAVHRHRHLKHCVVHYPIKHRV